MKTNINLSDILSTIRFNQGHMPTHELAMMLGKRHSDVIRKLESQGVLMRNLRSIVCETQVGRKGGGIQTYDSYLLNDEQAVALAMSYDMQLGMLVYRGFKSALEVVDAVNAGEDPAIIAQKAEEATLKALQGIIADQVCLKQMTAKQRADLAMCTRLATVETGGVMNSHSNLKEFLCSFAVQAELKGVPLRTTFKANAMSVIDAVYASEKKRLDDHREYMRNYGSSW